MHSKKGIVFSFLLFGGSLLHGSMIGHPNLGVVLEFPAPVAEVGGGGNFAEDAFTGTDGTNLQSHTPDIGTSWTDRDGASTGFQINTNRCHTNLGGDFYGYYLAPDPADADYMVQVDVLTSGSAKTSPGPAIRMDTTGNGDVIFARWSGGDTRWEIYERDDGSVNLLGSGLLDAPTSAQTAKLNATSVVPLLYIGGVLKATGGTTGVTATGKAGVYDYFGDAGVGENMDNLVANDAP